MEKCTKPRHIRDIAHLYLTGLAKSKSHFNDIVMVIGEDSSCFTALQIANLATSSALGFLTASISKSINICEISGLMPETGFYFSMPAESYMSRDEGAKESSVCALLNIKIDSSPGAASARRETLREGSLDFVHLPPLSNRSALAKALAVFDTDVHDGMVLLVVGKKEVSADKAAWLQDALGGKCRVSLLDIGKRIERNCYQKGALNPSGSLEGWHTILTDRLPVVLRSPRSVLAGAYESACESLLYRIKTSRRTVPYADRRRTASRIEISR